MSSWIHRITVKLAHLREADKNHTVFGASKHQYRLNPCLTEAEIQAFEQHHRITLPEDYRAFLLTVGNGGAGPYYGLFPLEKCLSHVSSDEVNPFSLSKDFPHTQQWNMAAETFPDEETFEQAYCQNHWVNGSLCLWHIGCGNFQVMVVSGVERGFVWNDARGSSAGIGPVSWPSERVTFASCYEHWLDKSLNSVAGKAH